MGSATRWCYAPGRSTFTLQCLPPEDYPVMASGELPHNFALAASELRTLIDRTRFAISTEETRYYLNGIYLHVTKNDEVPVMRAVATDGHRLARVEMVLPEGAAGMPGVIVPRKTVLELRKLVEEGENEVQIALSETKIRFAFGEAALTSKLIDGTFPDYDRVIPPTTTRSSRSTANPLPRRSTECRRSRPRSSRAVKLAIENGNLEVSATSPENGTAERNSRCATSRSPLEIGFNSRYLLDIAEQIDGEGAQFVMSDAGSPTILHDAADKERALRADADAGVSPPGDQRPDCWQNQAVSTHILSYAGRGTGSLHERRCRGRSASA